jgi:mono/diheme cytochrome c family protein
VRLQKALRLHRPLVACLAKTSATGLRWIAPVLGDRGPLTAWAPGIREAMALEPVVPMIKAAFSYGALIPLLIACDKPAESQPEHRDQATVAVAAPSQTGGRSGGDARKYFRSRCAVCHGATGGADGPGSAALSPKPRPFSDAAWQDGITDEELEKVIKDGGVSVGKSPGMPAHPDLKAQPELLKELIAFIRGQRAR